MDDEIKLVTESQPEEPKPAQKQRPRKTVRVNVVSRKDASALVEFVEGQAVQRKTVTAEALDGDKIAQDDLDLGVPYGIPWADLVKVTATPASIEKALHNAGIWTLEDLTSNPRRAIGALQAAYGLDLASLIRAANEYLN
jgi:hypothetical protein